MELRQLEYFQMASKLQNITRAAERLNVSQPNITVAIKKLEAELGIQLFDRSQKQLVLTPEGRVFLNRIELALRNIQDAILEVNDYKSLQRGTIKIGIPSMIGAYLFPKIFTSFREKYPHLDLRLFEEGSIAIREQLERDELDFGIVILANASDALQTLPMSTRHIVACVSEASDMAKRDSISLNDLRDKKLIMLKEGSFLRKMVLNTLRDANIPTNIVLETNQIDTIKGLVATDLGMSFFLDFIVEDTPGVKPLLFEPDISVDVGLAWKRDRYVSKASQSFIDFCKNTLNT